MLTITTTNNLDGYEVVEYLGIVTGEAVSGINMFRDIGAGLRNVFGGRSAGYEDEMAQAREEVLREMSQRAEKLGANAVIGANVGYENDHDHRVRHRGPRASNGVIGRLTLPGISDPCRKIGPFRKQNPDKQKPGPSLSPIGRMGPSLSPIGRMVRVFHNRGGTGRFRPGEPAREAS